MVVFSIRLRYILQIMKPSTNKRHSRTRFLTVALCLAGAALLLLAASCASGPYVQNKDSVGNLIELINKGGVGDIKGLSDSPFLFDGEILLLSDDVGSLWANLKSAGFRLENARIVSMEHITGDSYKAFGASMDVQVFFKKYLNQDSSLVRLEAKSGTWFLILNREVAGFPRIQGLRGPVK
jgi:hypothetical protein